MGRAAFWHICKRLHTLAPITTSAPRTRHSRTTLHHVAEHAHVSIATASRALNGLSVSSTSRQRVELAASELGYIANDAARALRRERTMTMGLVVPDLGSTLGIDLLDALSESIEDAGYSLLISTARGDVDRYDLLMRRFLERRADAVFCIRPVGRGAFLERFAEEAIPVMALFGGRGAFGSLPTINPSLADASAAVAAHLRDDGHRRVALVGGSDGPGQQAVASALTGRGVQVVHVDVSESGSTRDALADVMDTRHRPTAVVAPDPAVRGVVSACAALGVSVPGDLAVVGLCDRAAEPHFEKHGVSTLSVDPHRMGRAAGSSMLAWLEGERPAQRTRVSTGTFTARRSSETVDNRGN
jgi:LacI family transcriptional regulator